MTDLIPSSYQWAFNKHYLSDYFSLGNFGEQKIAMHVYVCKLWSEREGRFFFFLGRTVLIMIEWKKIESEVLKP